MSGAWLAAGQGTRVSPCHTWQSLFGDEARNTLAPRGRCCWILPVSPDSEPGFRNPIPLRLAMLPHGRRRGPRGEGSITVRSEGLFLDNLLRTVLFALVAGCPWFLA